MQESLPRLTADSHRFHLLRPIGFCLAFAPTATLYKNYKYILG
ncbi:hypothetical protein CAMRE0001_1250 [Campylobacter rectus RM3267]|uniref:Uncharacterized protein n=1 Tax=Campylobacter rectus RM3267 TaxID=553218 RepID=B9D0P0_CAMRE|nr:hypothetical protein CAMRE0001_1250 [Campylobacter rectus RM3267]